MQSEQVPSLVLPGSPVKSPPSGTVTLWRCAKVCSPGRGMFLEQVPAQCLISMHALAAGARHVLCTGAWPPPVAPELAVGRVLLACFTPGSRERVR